MKEYLFYDRVSGEEFFVNTDTKEKAYTYAYTYFEEPILLDVVSEGKPKYWDMIHIRKEKK